jgi:hypothetical protein
MFDGGTSEDAAQHLVQVHYPNPADLDRFRRLRAHGSDQAGMWTCDYCGETLRSASARPGLRIPACDHLDRCHGSRGVGERELWAIAQNGRPVAGAQGRLEWCCNYCKIPISFWTSPFDGCTRSLLSRWTRGRDSALPPKPSILAFKSLLLPSLVLTSQAYIPHTPPAA